MRNATLRTLMLGSVMPAATLAQTAQQPNIIFFLVDDMGWNETSVPFWKERTALNDRYRTPNMERLAALGVKFTNAYACPVSSPSRCSLMSGMNAARHRVTNWVEGYNSNTNASGGALTLPSWNYNGIQPAATAKAKDKVNSTLVTPLPQLLKDAGYTTIHIGKGNFGTTGTSSADPRNLGFTYQVAGSAAGAPGSYLAADNYGSGFYHVPDLDSYYEQGTFLTEALTIEALNYLNRAKRAGKPFFLYMSQYAIHTPYNADERFTGNYRQADGQGVYDELLGANLNTSEINHAALIEGMDKSLGDLMDWVESDPDVAANTIIIFMSDNGGQAVNPRQGRQNHDPNYPARGGKGSGYDGGIHEPMMVYWPGLTEGGTVNANRVIIEDFYPTILAMAGVTDYTTVQTLDGQDITPLLLDPTLRRDRPVITHYPNRWGETADRSEGYGTYSGLMKGEYHLLYFWETQERRLYNITDDPGEANNLAATMPELVQQMAQELTDSLIAMDAQRPTLTATGQLVPWPADAQEQEASYESGDVIPAAKVVKLSTADTKVYYTIRDNRAASAEGPYFWTQGEQFGSPAIQCTNEDYSGRADSTLQLFYFMQGASDQSVRLYTYDGKPVSYTEGTTLTSWNSSSTTTAKYLQYGVADAEELSLIVTDYAGYYGIRAANGDLMNDRGTSHGSAVNMKWAVWTYSGNYTGDTGSRYLFTEAGVEVPKPLVAGDVVDPATVVKLSDATTTYLYQVMDNRPTPFFWQRGTYNGTQAIQVNNEDLGGSEQAADQQFYFVATDDVEHGVQVYTAAGQPLALVSGTAETSLGNGNFQAANYLQYGTPTAGAFQMLYSGYDGYYGLRTGGDLMCDRGTSRGSAVNMAWCVMTYSGNHLGDQGSRYRFVPAGEVPTGIATATMANDKPTAVYDLQGRRVATPTQGGIYIIDGKKVAR
ncbi:MAG: sulfatase-like hydrolase/transferase [Bacteroidaceae bacterium]|nr:sulfatase-like hydrolase/transferase [Bacteroidaceae bacterium]